MDDGDGEVDVDVPLFAAAGMVGARDVGLPALHGLACRCPGGFHRTGLRRTGLGAQPAGGIVEQDGFVAVFGAERVEQARKRLHGRSAVADGEGFGRQSQPGQHGGIAAALLQPGADEFDLQVGDGMQFAAALAHHRLFIGRNGRVPEPADGGGQQQVSDPQPFAGQGADRMGSHRRVGETCSAGYYSHGEGAGGRRIRLKCRTF